MSRKYKQPPIIEAVCEFRFESGSPWDLAVPGLLYEKLRDSFPIRRPTKAFEATVAAGAEGIQQHVLQRDQSRFLRTDERALIQIGPHLLAINHLKPYPSWAVFRSMIRKALDAYREVADPKGFQRIGLRYINRFDFSDTRAQLERFFEFYPSVGQQLLDYTDFIMGIQVPFEDGRDILRLQMTSAVPDKPDSVSVVLDLDYFLGRPGKVTFGDEFQWLEQAHSRIEATFEGCLKETLRQQFEEVTQ
ncbi:MAG: TIGR04255 family protein [candidate division NC10 bacterium]|nr:TIGR04255 family protein [candidate division NC10 bacterium]MDE2322977.1 TIGR04255 family protein [candidate division NC10 bacterium]